MRIREASCGGVAVVDNSRNLNTPKGLLIVAGDTRTKNNLHYRAMRNLPGKGHGKTWS